MTRYLAETEQLVHNLDSHVMTNPEAHDSRSSPGVQPVSQDEQSSLKGDKTAASQANAWTKVSSFRQETMRADAIIRTDDLEELLDIANTRVRATEGLAGKPLDEEEVIWIVNDVVESRRKTEWCKIGGCTTDLQMSLANANSFQKVVVLITALLLQRRNRVAGGNVENGVSTLDSTNREDEAPGITSRRVLSLMACTSKKGADEDDRAPASASSLDRSSTPLEENVADEPLCNKENVDPVHSVEYTMDELDKVLSNAIAAHSHAADVSTDSSIPSSPEVSFEDNTLTIDMIFEKFLELLPPGLGLDTSDIVESLPDDEQNYESFAHDTSTLVDAETTFDTKDGDTIDDTEGKDGRAYAELLSNLFSDANKLKEASLAAVAAAETSLLGPLFGHDHPVTSMFSSGEAMGACDARQPESSDFDLHCDPLHHCETWDAQLAENFPLSDVRRPPSGLIDEATKRWNFSEGCHGGDGRAAHAQSCSLTEMRDQFPDLLCSLDNYKSCDEQNERGGNPDQLIMDPHADQSGKAVKEQTGPSTEPLTVRLRTDVLRKQLRGRAQDDGIIRQGSHAVRVVLYQSGDVEEKQPFDELNAGLASSNSTTEGSCRAPLNSSHFLPGPVESEALEHWTSFANSPFDEFLNAPSRPGTQERLDDFNPFPSQRQAIPRSGAGKYAPSVNRIVQTQNHPGNHLDGITSSPSTKEGKSSSPTSTSTTSQIGSESWRSHRFFKPQRATKAPHPGSHQVINSDARHERGCANEKATVGHGPAQNDPIGTTKAPQLGSRQVKNSDACREGGNTNENTHGDDRPIQNDPNRKTKGKSLAGITKQRSRALRSHGTSPPISTGFNNAVGRQSIATYSPNIPWESFHADDHARVNAPLLLSAPSSPSSPAYSDRHTVSDRRGRSDKCITGGEQSSPSSVGDFSKNMEDVFGF